MLFLPLLTSLLSAALLSCFQKGRSVLLFLMLKAGCVYPFAGHVPAGMYWGAGNMESELSLSLIAPHAITRELRGSS